MFKSILAVSEGGPDAAMSFALAARVAGVLDGVVDALHLPVGPAGGMVGGLAMSGEAMPLIMNIDDERLEARAKESERIYSEVVAPVMGSTYTAAKTATLDTLVAMGRCSDLIVLGRPGADPENVAPATVEAAIHECAAQIGHVPSFPELTTLTKVRRRAVFTHFGKYTNALRESGLERKGPGYEVSPREMFLDWAGVTRSLGMVPSMGDYGLKGVLKPVHSGYYDIKLRKIEGVWKITEQRIIMDIPYVSPPIVPAAKQH